MLTNRFIHCVEERRLVVLGSVGLAALSLILAAPLLLELSPPTIRVSAGPGATRRHAIVVTLREQANRNGLAIRLVTNAGSEDCLKQLKTGQLDAAVVCSGVIVPDDEKIAVLGALQSEAVHMLVRKDIAAAGQLVEAIRGKRVNIGEPGSTERLLAHEFVKFAHLKLPSADYSGDIIAMELGKAELFEKSHAILNSTGPHKAALVADLPDCLPVLESMPSPLVQLLVEAADYEIVPMPATRAFLMDNLQDGHAGQTVVQRSFLERTSIPAHCYFAQRAVPSADCETVGVRLVVVARQDLSARAVRLLMKTIFEGELAHRLKPMSPRDLATPHAIHPAAAAYLDRNKPLLVQSVMEWASKGLSLFGAFSAAALSLYGLLRRGKTRKPADYFAEIRKVEQLALSAGSDVATQGRHAGLTEQMDECLLKLRHDLIEDICEGRIKSDQSISNILLFLKEVRRNTTASDRQGADAREHRATHFPQLKKGSLNGRAAAKIVEMQPV